MSKLMPAFFIGHGNPMNALLSNAYTKGWKLIGEQIPTPKSILIISAHWYIPQTAVTVSLAPKTIHDFGGFPHQLYQIEYPAPGDPQLAHSVKQLLNPMSVLLDDSWGLDHGAWSILTHMFPGANIPVIQLSINEIQNASYHFEIGKKLATLREEGVLIIGSGNLVHNLHSYAWGRHVPVPYDWAGRFEDKARKLIINEDFDPLIHYEQLGEDALMSIPTPEHYLPLLYVLGTKQAHETLSFPIEGIEGGSISMLTLSIR